MFAVIFRAEVGDLDDEYHVTATRMRDLAIEEYGCIEFISACENNVEIAISYWPSISHIKKWHSNPEHIEAQIKGKSKWYKTYKVEITNLENSYGSST